MNYYAHTNVTAYPIPDGLADRYRGCGEGWAIINGEKIEAIGYDEPPAGATTGMLSCWEFCRHGDHRK